MGNFVKKSGLVYSEDFRIIIGVDANSSEFQGIIPYGAYVIEDEIFEDCPYVNFSIPDSVKSIGAALFRNSKRLVSVKLPSSITELSPYLFSDCTALTKVTMPDTLNALPEGLFYNCSSMADIPFRAGIKELPENVAAGCTSLRSLVIPPTVKVIRKNAASGCSSLLSLVLPEELVELEDGAFDGCTALRNIRISSENKIFYVNEEDGCLYERTAGGDRLRLKVVSAQVAPVQFYKENVDDETDEFFTDEGLFEEEDSVFSSTVSLDETEESAFDSVVEADSENEEIKITEEEKEIIMSDMDDLVADIMGGEKERSVEGEKVSISQDELENVFSEPGVEDQHETKADDKEITGKTKILLDSAEVSKIIYCEPEGEAPQDADLFVIAEKTVTGADGNPAFTEKLEKCVKKFAAAQDYKRIFMISGLPVENDEFMQFYYHFMSGRNIVFATEAASPSKLSDYARTICQQSRISLDKEDLIHQRKQISIKNNNLVKLVIQDLYN